MIVKCFVRTLIYCADSVAANIVYTIIIPVHYTVEGMRMVGRWLASGWLYGWLSTPVNARAQHGNICSQNSFLVVVLRNQRSLRPLLSIPDLVFQLFCILSQCYTVSGRISNLLLENR